MAAPLDIIARLHRRFLEIVATALPLLAGSRRDADLDGLAALRAEMVEALAAYRREAGRRHALALCSANPDAIDAADLLFQGSRTLERAYDDFRRRWADREAEANWHEYRLSAIRMMKQIRNQVQAAEERRGGQRRAA